MNKEQLEFIAAMTGPDLDGLGQISPYVSWPTGEKKVKLDGNFTADQLEAIIWFMRGGPSKIGLPSPSWAELITEEERAELAKPTRHQHADTFKGLSTRTVNALYSEGIYTVPQLVKYYAIDKETLRRPIVFLPGIGAKGIADIHAWLRARGDLPGREMHP